jgi:transcriptional regulator with XRE-family HTH domain
MAGLGCSAADPVTVRTAGPLLRIWRTNVLSMTVRQLAAALHVSASSISQWETDDRTIDRGILRSIQELGADADREVGQILDRAGTPAALAATRRWEHNFPSHADGVFIWIRASEPNCRMTINAHWGIVQLDLATTVGVNGILITGPGAVTNPRLVVDLEPDGWCDFFIGAPSERLGIEIIEAVPLFRVVKNRSPFAVLFARHLRSNMPDDPEAISAAVGIDVALVREMMGIEHGDAEPAEVSANDVEVRVNADLAFRQARVAYSLSQQQLADAVNELTGWFVTQDSISRLERGLAVNNVLLAAAVDRALGADGRLASVPFRTIVEGTPEIKFPSWWVGPIWIQVNEPALVSLTWPPYAKRVRVDGGSGVLYTRCADPTAPLMIELAPGSVAGTIGLGRHPGSIDVNDHWWHASVDSLNQVMFMGEELTLKVFKRPRAAITALLRSRRR